MNKNRPLGCLTFSAISASILTLLVITASALAAGSGFFTPGSLNAQSGTRLGGVSSHAEIKTDCAKCHPAPWDTDSMGQRCVKCHTDLAAQLADPKSIHGAIKGQQAVLNCRPCHPDHRGPDASLTRVVSEGFPHEMTGFALTAHAKRYDGIPFSCSDCHVRSFKQFDRNLCADCHKERDKTFTVAHIDEFGMDCLGCHDGVDRFGKNFNHNLYAFKLDGKHAAVQCSKCHMNARTLADLQNIPADCKSCHLKDDAHNGSFGTACGDCHNPAGWQENIKFDHSLVNFKLVGKHVNVECVKCHTVPHQFKGTPTDCYSCHLKDDKHKGQYGQSCADCHTPVTWAHDKLDHNVFAFKLTGAHATVDCTQCHQTGVFKDTPATCFACHQKDDFHKGQYGQQCDLCHSTTAWKPSTFNHQTSSFPLTGAHVNTKCSGCHKNGQFQNTPTFCSGCHSDPAFHSGLFGTSCEKCHSTSNWNAQYTGPHPSFGEEGGIHHGGASCTDCHTVNLMSATCTKCHSGNNPGND